MHVTVDDLKEVYDIPGGQDQDLPIGAVVRYAEDLMHKYGGQAQKVKWVQGHGYGFLITEAAKAGYTWPQVVHVVSHKPDNVKLIEEIAAVYRHDPHSLELILDMKRPEASKSEAIREALGRGKSKHLGLTVDETLGIDASMALLVLHLPNEEAVSGLRNILGVIKEAYAKVPGYDGSWAVKLERKYLPDAVQG